MASDAPNPDELFQCRMCGDCCRGYGGTYVTDEDIAAISRFLDLNRRHFVERYCRRSGRRFVLGQRDDGYCVFWDQRCTIHPVKPRMCRQWPFIPGVLADPFNWQIMAKSCPGMKPDPPAETVVACVRRMLDPAADLEKSGG